MTPSSPPQTPPSADLAYYDRIAREYFQRQNQPIQRYTTRVESRWLRAMVPRESDVLLVGSGGAREIGALLDMGCRITALDYCQEMLSAGERYWSGRDVQWVLGDAHDLHAYRGRFDVVLSLAAINYFVDAAAATKEMADALRTGGRLVVSCINRLHATEQRTQLARGSASVTRKLYCPDELRDFAESAGLTVESVRGVRAFSDRLPPAWNRDGASRWQRFLLGALLCAEPLTQRLFGPRGCKFFWLVARR